MATTADDVIKAIEESKAANNARLKILESEVGELLKKAGRPMAGASTEFCESTAPSTDGWVNSKTGEPIRALKHGQMLAEPSSKGAPSVGRILRGMVLGGAAHDADDLATERKAMNIFSDPSGGYTVSGMVADQWVDNLRAASVLSRAGAVTLPMESGEVKIARVTADPTCSWHGESGAVPEASPTFGAATLSAKTVVCLVKFSVELAQDATNLEMQLQGVVTKAMAQAIDSAGLVGVTTNAAVAPTGIMNLSGRNSVTSIGAPTSWDFLVDGAAELLTDNVPLDRIGAFIAHPAVWKKMVKLKSGITNDKTPLALPSEVSAIPKLWTTAAPLTGGTTADGVMGDWGDLVMGIRQQITVRVLSETFVGSNLQIALLAYARVDFAATRPQSFCTLEGITV